MGRPRTATNLLDARGAFRRNPQRKRPNEPKPTGAFPKAPPKQLTQGQRATWRELVKAAPAGVLTAADTITVEITACLLAEFRSDSEGMPTARLARLTTQLGKLGLDPSGRASLVVPKEDKNEFDEV